MREIDATTETFRIIARRNVEPTPKICHSFITDGEIQFLNDCTHKLAGHTVDLLEWDYD